MKRKLLKIIHRSFTKEEHLLLVAFLLGGIFFVYYNLISSLGEQQFFVLAKAFTQGHLYLGPSTITQDGSYYRGFAYWPQGIFPAILLTPFVFFFGQALHQGHLQFFLNIVNLFLLYKISFKITKNKTISLWLSFGYIFSTVYLPVGLIPWSWWFAQVVATSCLLLLLYEQLHQKRWLVMGIYVALAMSTRIDLVFAVLFPLLSLFFSKQKVIKKVANSCLLISPLFFALALIAWYNFTRFGSVWEFGYTYHIPSIAMAGQMLREHGTWSLFYFPTNLYYLFFKGVDIVYAAGTKYLTYPFVRLDQWGMSIFLTSPILLWCLKTKRSEQLVKIAAVPVLLILLFLLGYFGIGAKQYGYRYALDFQPFLFIMLCYAFRSGMSRVAKTVIVVSFLFNLLFFSGIFTVAVH